MPTQRALDVIDIRQPCPASWETMAGDTKQRFCSHCNKLVHDLSAMPADEAERLVCEGAGNLCVRFARDPQSGAILLNYQPAPKVSRLRAILTIASLLSAFSFTGAWAAYKLLVKPPPNPPVYVLGDMSGPPTTNPTVCK